MAPEPLALPSLLMPDGSFQVIFNTMIAMAISYLLGSIPFVYIASRLKKGIDIRQVGDGNMGALNAM